MGFLLFRIKTDRNLVLLNTVGWSYYKLVKSVELCGVYIPVDAVNIFLSVSGPVWTNQTLEQSGHCGGVAGRQDVYMIDFMNRVSEALKGRKVNRGCQAWMG